MATINYQCDTCKRDIELLENLNGLTVFNSCTITQGCRGNLYAISRNPNNIRESLPPYSDNLADYVKRKFFFPYKQTVPSLTWIVKHGLGDSCVFIVYDSTNTVVDQEAYTVTSGGVGVSIITFKTKMAGIVHIISRTGGANYTADPLSTFDFKVSANGILTFAIPKYLTRMDSDVSQIYPVDGAPPPSASPLPLPTSPLYTPCDKRIKVEIEVIQPNQPSVTCIETLDATINTASAWFGWNEILVRNRKHYCIRTISIPNLKVFSNTNNKTPVIPDGTILRFIRIDYGTNVLVDIPDRGLLMLFAEAPYTTSDKIVNKLLDIGEMVDIPNEVFGFTGNELYVNCALVEKSYPKITKFS